MTDEASSDKPSPAATAAEGEYTMSLGKALAVGQSFHQNGYFDQAQDVYQQILAAKPNQPEALHFLGVLLHQIGKSQEGETLILAALELVPDYVDAISNLGNIYVGTERYTEAGQLYRRAIATKPDFLDAHLNLAILYYQCGRNVEAIAEWEYAMELSPEFLGLDSTKVDAEVDANGARDQAMDSSRGTDRKPLRRGIYECMANSFMRLKRRDEAVAVLRRWQEIEPDNPEPQHQMAALTGIDIPRRASDGYVKSVFNRFADSFDKQLEKLDYSAPARAIEMVAEQLGEPRACLSILDAGCGTGLCAAGIRPFANRLIGVDLSSDMLEKARQRELYDELVEAELTGFLIRFPQTFDLILSTDVLIYFGVLSEFMTAASAALRPDGRIVFTLESAPEEEAPNGYSLQYNGRYRHSRSYVVNVMQQAFLEVVSIRECFLRTEGDTNVMGLLGVGRRISGQGMQRS